MALIGAKLLLFALVALAVFAATTTARSVLVEREATTADGDEYYISADSEATIADSGEYKIETDSEIESNNGRHKRCESNT